MAQGYVANTNTTEYALRLVQGRLTLTSNTPVTTSDVTAATTVYFTPFRGNRISLYDGAAWQTVTFSETSFSVPATTDTVYDVWGYLSSSALALDTTAWTNDTTRATALTTQNGIYVKNGDATRRYLGSFRTTGVSGQTEDSLVKRYVWNYYNRIKRAMTATDSTNTWTYSTTTFRQSNANTANQLDFLIGVSEDSLFAIATSSVTSSTTTMREVCANIGVDGSITPTFNLAAMYKVSSAYQGYPYGLYDVAISEGRHTLVWLERGAGANTQTWRGDDNTPTYTLLGIYGYLFC